MTQEEFRTEAQRLRPRLILVARRYLAAADAEDAVQDALLRLWQMVDELHAPLDSLATVLTRNLAVSAVRRQRPQAQLTDVADTPVASPDQERVDRLMAIVDTLPATQQLILRLRHMEGMDMAQVAALIGSSEVALRKALSRARQAVRNKYLQHNE